MSAEQGHANAQGILGGMYYVGDGVPEDYVQAYAWLSLAAAQGNKNSVMAKDIIRKDLTQVQLAEAQRPSRELCAKIPNCVR